jgi:tRNA G10  N-methylase Trm11
MKHFFVFGTHPELSLSEAKAVLGDFKPILSGSAAILDIPDWDGAVLQNRLAGTIKLGDILFTVSSLQLTAIQLADFIEQNPRADRVLFGLTLHGGSPTKRKALKNLPIQLKRELQSRGKSVRWVTGDNGEIAGAAISKMHLDTEGYDFNIFLHGDDASVGLTTHVQNIDAWSERDFGRPFRDAKTGMLPPKLARIMLNLGRPQQVLLDPFCGGGTVLMEAGMLFPDLKLVGSDIDAKQVAGAMRNNEWLVSRRFLHASDLERIRLIVSPVQKIDSHIQTPVDTIVTEGYLGKPLSGHETQHELDQNKRDVEAVWNESLPVLARLQPAGSRLVCIWPSMKSSHGSVMVDCRNQVERSGYQVAAEHQYARPDQNIRRNIIILEKKG